MKDKLFKAIHDFNLLENGDSVLVGFSGGADSLCLLHLLNSVKNELGISVAAAHVNHCLRGSESDADESFAVDFCKKNNIELFVKRIDINDLCSKNGKSTELCARDERYAFFASLDFNKTATAHTGSDCIETMLMNLSRGASLHGLCSIPPRRDKIIRPLIYFTREETERYCKENNLSFVTDSSNLTDEYTRNKFRHTVINQLKAVNPSFEQNAMRCLELLRDEDAFIAGEAKKAFDSCVLRDGDALSLRQLVGFSPCIRRRCIASFLSANQITDYEQKHIFAIEQQLGKCFSVTLPSGVTAKGDKETVFFAKQITLHSVAPDEIVFDKNSGFCGFYGKYKITVYTSDKKIKSNNNVSIVDFSKIHDIIKIRSRFEGDKLALKKRKCTKSLKKLFNELHIRQEERDLLPVFVDDSGIIAVGTVEADASRVFTSETEKFLIIKTERDKNE